MKYQTQIVPGAPFFELCIKSKVVRTMQYLSFWYQITQKKSVLHFAIFNSQLNMRTKSRQILDQPQGKRGETWKFKTKGQGWRKMCFWMGKEEKERILHKVYLKSIMWMCFLSVGLPLGQRASQRRRSSGKMREVSGPHHPLFMDASPVMKVRQKDLTSPSSSHLLLHIPNL